MSAITDVDGDIWQPSGEGPRVQPGERQRRRAPSAGALSADGRLPVTRRVSSPEGKPCVPS